MYINKSFISLLHVHVQLYMCTILLLMHNYMYNYINLEKGIIFMFVMLILKRNTLSSELIWSKAYIQAITGYPTILYRNSMKFGIQGELP